MIDLHIAAINTDAAIFEEPADNVCPMRDLPRGVQAPAMSFGDGHHRCPGAYIAIQESDMVLKELMAIPNIRLVSEPTMHFRNSIKGYETRNFIVAID